MIVACPLSILNKILFSFSFQCWVSNPPSPPHEKRKTMSFMPLLLHLLWWNSLLKMGERQREREKKKTKNTRGWNHHSRWLNVFSSVWHIHMQPGDILTWKWLVIMANHGLDAPSSAARGFGNHVTRTLHFHSCVIPLTDSPLFREAACTAIDFQRMLLNFGAQSTMQGEGRSIMMSNGSSRVWSSVAARLQRSGCPAHLCWTTGPLPAGGNLLIHIRKHQPYHMYIWRDPIYLTASESSERLLAASDLNTNTGISVDPRGFTFSPPWDGI